MTEDDFPPTARLMEEWNDDFPVNTETENQFQENMTMFGDPPVLNEEPAAPIKPR